MSFKKILIAVLALVSLVIFSLDILKHPTIYFGGMSVINVVLCIVIALYFLYPVLNRAFGVSIHKDGRKYHIRLPVDSRKTQAGVFLSFIGTLCRFGYFGFRDFDSFRLKLAETDSPVMRKEMLTWFGVLACFNYGIINVPFLVLFWMCLNWQFNEDEGAASHVGACESLFGLTFLFMKPFHVPIPAIYPFFCLVWIGMYSLSANRSMKVLLLQVAKLVIFLAAFFVPYYLAHNGTLHF